MTRRKNALTIFETIGVIVVLVVLVALLLPAKRGAREAARRNQCLSQVKQITLALHNYHDDHGSLPPAYTVDENGNRLHSWRTLILPYMEETALYEMIDLTKPWDDPANEKARQAEIRPYQCPSAPFEENNLTTYLAIVGPDCAFSGSVPRKFSDVTDDHAKTLVIIDAPADQAVHWMSPNDASVEMVLNYDQETQTNHPHIFMAGYLDGHAKPINVDCDRETRRALMTIAGGEKIEE